MVTTGNWVETSKMADNEASSVKKVVTTPGWLPGRLAAVLPINYGAKALMNGQPQYNYYTLKATLQWQHVTKKVNQKAVA